MNAYREPSYCWGPLAEEPDPFPSKKEFSETEFINAVQSLKSEVKKRLQFRTEMLNKAEPPISDKPDPPKERR